MLRMRMANDGTTTGILPSDEIKFSGYEVSVMLGLMPKNVPMHRGMDAIGLCYNGCAWTKEMLRGVESYGVNVREFSKKLFGVGVLTEPYDAKDFPEYLENSDYVVWPMTRELDALRVKKSDVVIDYRIHTKDGRIFQLR